MIPPAIMQPTGGRLLGRFTSESTFTAVWSRCHRCPSPCQRSIHVRLREGDSHSSVPGNRACHVSNFGALTIHGCYNGLTFGKSED